MRISCCFDPADIDAHAWRDALGRALPQAVVEIWYPDAAPADYAIVWRPAQAFFDSEVQLKAIFNAGAGVDALLQLRLPPSVPIVRLADAGMAEQMADYVSHAVLRHFREFDVYDVQARARQWQPRAPRRKIDFPIGILGLGVLGRRVAETLQAIGFPVHAWTRSDKTHASLRVFSGDAGFDEFLKRSRILVCLLPLTPETHHILNRATLARLRPNAFLINAARGAHLVESDLIAALDEGVLAGAALDVCQEEPLPAVHPFWTHPKITLTPHIAAATLRDEAVAQIAANIAALERGAPLQGLVDPQRGY